MFEELIFHRQSLEIETLQGSRCPIVDITSDLIKICDHAYHTIKPISDKTTRVLMDCKIAEPAPVEGLIKIIDEESLKNGQKLLNRLDKIMQ